MRLMLPLSNHQYGCADKADFRRAFPLDAEAEATLPGRLHGEAAPHAQHGSA
jgi:hypothetical protein